MPLTFLVCGYWHGIQPGYFFLMSTLAFSVLTENSLKPVRQKMTPWLREAFDTFWWFWYMRCADFAMIPYFVLTWDATIQCWGNIYYYILVVNSIFIIFGNLFALLTRNPKAELANNNVKVPETLNNNLSKNK